MDGGTDAVRSLPLALTTGPSGSSARPAVDRRFARDSRWKGNMKNLVKAKIQLFFQKALENKITGSLASIYNLAGEVEVDRLSYCWNNKFNKWINRWI